MAIRNIRLEDDSILRKISKKVDKIDDRIRTLVADMKETMAAADGVGLAAVQVGVLRRVIVVDVGEGPFEIINPEIITSDGAEIMYEGCLSVPGKSGTVERPKNVTVRGMNLQGEAIEIAGQDLMARAFCHEVDHLNGVLFTDKVIEYKKDDEPAEE